jgi:hypothetical protein
MVVILESNNDLGNGVQHLEKPDHMNSGIRSQEQGTDQVQGDCEQCAKEGKGWKLGHR